MKALFLRWPQIISGILFLSACTGLPQGVAPVDGFELERYLGKWYEIARLDHRFERGLSRVTAEYRRREDGGIDVINRGYDVRGDRWKLARGRPILSTIRRWAICRSLSSDLSLAPT